MTKRYSTTYSNGHTRETSQWCEAANFAFIEDGQSFFLSGKKVSPSVFFGEVSDAAQAAEEKKLLTHKRVRVLHGSSVAGYVEKWVRR